MERADEIWNYHPELSALAQGRVQLRERSHRCFEFTSCLLFPMLMLPAPLPHPMLLLGRVLVSGPSGIAIPQPLSTQGPVAPT